MYPSDVSLTHLPLDKMATILADNIFKLIFLNKNGRILTQISLKFVPSIGSGNGLAPSRGQAITWTNDDPVHWGIYAALGGDELIHVYTSPTCCLVWP